MAPVRSAKAARRTDIDLACYLPTTRSQYALWGIDGGRAHFSIPLATQITRTVFPGLVGSGTWHRGSQLSVEFCGRQRRRETVGIHLRLDLAQQRAGQHSTVREAPSQGQCRSGIQPYPLSGALLSSQVWSDRVWSGLFCFDAVSAQHRRCPSRGNRKTRKIHRGSIHCREK